MVYCFVQSYQNTGHMIERVLNIENLHQVYLFSKFCSLMFTAQIIKFGKS